MLLPSFRAGSRDYSVQLWDIGSGKSVAKQSISRNVVTCACWLNDEQLVWQGSEDLQLRLWDTRAFQKPAATIGGFTYFPLACDCDSHLLLTGSNGMNSNGCEIRLWCAASPWPAWCRHSAPPMHPPAANDEASP